VSGNFAVRRGAMAHPHRGGSADSHVPKNQTREFFESSPSVNDPIGLRAEAKRLRHIARDFSEQKVVDQVIALANELDRRPTALDGKSTNGHS
jgi:hypothetical protein